MAASGGFWAKGIFVGALQVQVMGFETSHSAEWLKEKAMHPMTKGYYVAKAAFNTNFTIYNAYMEGPDTLNTVHQELWNEYGPDGLAALAAGAKQKIDEYEAGAGEAVVNLNYPGNLTMKEALAAKAKADAEIAASPMPDSTDLGNILADNSFEDIHPSVMNNGTSAWAKSLPADQLGAIKDYTSSGYGAINGNLRSGAIPIEQLKMEYPQIPLLDKVTAGAPALPKGMLYRGFGNATIHNAAAKGLLKPGTQLVDKAYMSTSISPGQGKGFIKYENPVYYRIRTPQGTKGGAYVENVSAIKGESEVVFGRNYSLTVINVQMGTVGVKSNVAIIDVVPTNMLGGG